MPSFVSLPHAPDVVMISRLCSHVKSRWTDRDLVVFVDNCYGEFVEDQEPCHVGADLVAGSLIKNPGGTVVKSGEKRSGNLCSFDNVWIQEVPYRALSSPSQGCA